MEEKPILIVDDDDSQRRLIEFWLQEEGYRSVAAANGKAGLQLFEEVSPRLVIADIRMPQLSGLDLLGRIKSASPDTPVILITAFGTVTDAVEAMKLGASDYLLKPLNTDEFKIVIRRVLEHQQLLDENRYLRGFAEKSFRFENLIGSSPKMRELFELALQVADRESTVLLVGESGTGKELLAKAIHQNSPRRDKPFVTVNCGAIAETLIESELFGHRKGAFTGAVSDRQGKFEAASQGTVFLDEVSELKQNLQVKLLRVIQEREIDKVGYPHPIKVNVRIVAATNRDLRTLVDDGQFREDLYYRLSVVTLRLPPLRERREDVPALLEHFLAKYCQRYNLPLVSVSPEALQCLLRHNWPGNVRELENVVEHVLVVGKDSVVRAEHLPVEILLAKPRIANLKLELPDDGISLEQVEKEILLQALERHNWNQTHAAKYLDITRKTLIYRMEKHGIRAPGASAEPREVYPATDEQQ
jgi:two-component system NtrC family response regulator